MKPLLYAFLLCAFGHIAVFAQTSTPPETQGAQTDPFITKHSERRAENPEGLLFSVRLKEKRKQFQQGERIALELSFASSKPETLTLDAATYDRSGRLHSDGFTLDQLDGVVDPLHDYFYSSLNGFIMGGLRSIPDLTEKPYLINADLNEWQRIDKPGHYRMYVVSGRVAQKGQPGFFLGGGLTAVSNVIEFEVLPADKKWAANKLKEIKAALSKPGRDHRSACRALRFLGTPEAVVELRKRFRGDDDTCEWEYKFGLIGSPHRDLVISEMANAISLREQPVTSHYLRTLVLLEFAKRKGPETPYVSGADSDDQVRAQMERQERVYDELYVQYLRQLVLAIPEKQGEARASSLKTLLDNRSKLNTRAVAQWDTLLALLPKVFTRLPLDDQLSLLQYGWKSIASPAMLPAVREVFGYTYDPSSTTDLAEAVNEFQQEEIRSAALRRLYELSPQEGRRLIIEAIRGPKLRVENKVLRLLPDETLPELNAVLLQKLEEKNNSGSWAVREYSELIERYATDEIFSRVRAVYESQTSANWDCQAKAALLAYFLRVAPSLGAEYLNQALAARENGYSNCHREILERVADLHMSKEVEAAAVVALEAQDAEVVSKAALTLAKHGRAESEELLWKRFEKLHETYSSSAEGAQEQKLNDDQEKIEKALIEALTHGQSWIMDPEKLKRVRDLCLTDKRREEVDRMVSGWRAFVNVGLNIYGEPHHFNVAHYSFESMDLMKQKLLQFPKGTVIEFLPPRERNSDPAIEDLFQQLKSYLEENGLSLKREASN